MDTSVQRIDERFWVHATAQLTVLDQMILGQTLQTRSTREALRDQQPSRHRELVFLRRRPAMHVLQERGEG